MRELNPRVPLPLLYRLFVPWVRARAKGFATIFRPLREDDGQSRFKFDALDNGGGVIIEYLEDIWR